MSILVKEAHENYMDLLKNRGIQEDEMCRVSSRAFRKKIETRLPFLKCSLYDFKQGYMFYSRKISAHDAISTMRYDIDGFHVFTTAALRMRDIMKSMRKTLFPCLLLWIQSIKNLPIFQKK